MSKYNFDLVPGQSHFVWFGNNDKLKARHNAIRMASKHRKDTGSSNSYSYILRDSMIQITRNYDEA